VAERSIRRDPTVGLVDLLDRVLASGVVAAGDVVLSAANVDLVYLNLRLLVGSVPTIRRDLAEALEAGPAALLEPAEGVGEGRR
jgi:hypothetical protein